MTKLNLYLKTEANNFRVQNGFGLTEPIRLTSLLLKLNVLTAFKPLSDKFSGMSVENGDYKFMLVNSRHPIGKQHFTICHELYHLYVQKKFTPHICNTGTFNKGDKEEYSAELFAAYLLIPDEGIISMVPKDEMKKNKISIQTILKVEQYFSCSRRALLYRLKELNFIDSNLYDIYSKNVQLSALQFGYSNYLYNPGNDNVVIGNYGETAKLLYDREKISESHYVELMRDIGFDVGNINTDINDTADTTR
jgi:Zn-dependent peptidase ImmA (M78 family)